MKAAWYEKQGPAREVLTVGEMPDPNPGSGEATEPSVQIPLRRLAFTSTQDMMNLAGAS